MSWNPAFNLRSFLSAPPVSDQKVFVHSFHSGSEDILSTFTSFEGPLFEDQDQPEEGDIWG